MRKRKTGINGKRAMSVLTAAVMLTAEVATVAGAAFIGTKPLTTQAVRTEKKLQFGKGSIATQDRVLYGKKYSDDSLSDIYDSGNGKYIVLDASKDNTGHDGAMFVLSDNLWGNGGARGNVYFNNEPPYSKVYQGSDAQAWCVAFADAGFGTDTPERKAIRQINKDDGAYTQLDYNTDFATSKLDKDEVFFLSAEEADDYITGTKAAVYNGGNGYWWLRSPYAHHTHRAGLVDNGGSVYDDRVYNASAARPAFNIETDHILFSADSEWDKPNDDELVSVTTGDVDTWRLTLKITGLTAGYESVAQNEDEPRKILLGGYTKSETGDRTSVMVTDADETEILYYGKLHEDEDNADFTLPDALSVADWGTDYKVFLVREDIHEDGSFASDLAGEPIEIDAPEGSKDVTGVTLNHNTLQLQTGSSADLTATVEPGDADDDTVVWSSSNESIATVNNNGKVTAVAEGTATIKVTATNGTDDTDDDFTDECVVTVTDAAVVVEAVELNRHELTLETGVSKTLTATITPAGACEDLEWSSSDEAVATVDADGKVTGVAEGTAVITVKSTEDGTKSDTCEVTVVTEGEDPDPEDSDNEDKDPDTKSDDSSNSSKPSGKSKHHVHDYEWVMTKEATPYENGEYVYRCKGCGHVADRKNADGTAALTNAMQNAIAAAPENGTVRLDCGYYMSINKTFAEAHDLRPDVTVVFIFLDKGVRKELTIPAGVKLVPMLNEDGWAGFKCIAGYTEEGVTLKELK